MFNCEPIFLKAALKVVAFSESDMSGFDIDISLKYDKLDGGSTSSNTFSKLDVDLLSFPSELDLST